MAAQFFHIGVDFSSEWLYNTNRKRQDLKRLCQKSLFIKNNASFDGGRYFFMEITKSKRIIINEIMYSLSIAITSFQGDDGITAQLLHCFQSYLLTDFSDKNNIQTYFLLFKLFL